MSYKLEWLIHICIPSFLQRIVLLFENQNVLTTSRYCTTHCPPPAAQNWIWAQTLCNSNKYSTLSNDEQACITLPVPLKNQGNMLQCHCWVSNTILQYAAIFQHCWRPIIGLNLYAKFYNSLVSIKYLSLLLFKIQSVSIKDRFKIWLPQLYTASPCSIPDQ